MDYSLQAPLSMGFPKQEYWSGLPFPFPGDLPDPGIEPVSSALADWFFTGEPHILSNTCGSKLWNRGLGSVFLGYPYNFPMVFSIWALQLRLGNSELLKLTTYQNCSPHFANSLENFMLNTMLVSVYLLLFCSCSQEEWDVALHFLQVHLLCGVP